MGASGGEGWGVATRGGRWDEGFNGKGLGGRPQGVARGGIGNRCQGDGATAKLETLATRRESGVWVKEVGFGVRVGGFKLGDSGINRGAWQKLRLDLDTRGATPFFEQVKKPTEAPLVQRWPGD